MDLQEVGWGGMYWIDLAQNEGGGVGSPLNVVTNH